MRHVLRAALLVLAAAPLLLAAPSASASQCDHHDKGKHATASAGAEAGSGSKAEAKGGDYVCPMGPECGGYQKQPGECAVCGMKLVHKSELKKQ